MTYRELYTSQTPFFSGYQATYEKARYVILGAPFDATSTYRTGTRFAPLAIREASLNIETFSFRTGKDLENIKIHDSGDAHTTSDTEETNKRLALVIKDIIEAKKTPITIGGEHTITLGAVKGINENAAVISFDAHLDLRDEYMNLKTSHTTFMRRINEQVKPRAIVEIGTRAVCREELDYAEKAGITYVSAQEIQKTPIQKVLNQIKAALRNSKKIYISIDMDVLDPAFAPAVQNPEADGLTSEKFFDLLQGITDKRVVAADVVEVTPPYDNGNTAALAARIIFELICNMEKTRKP